MQAQDSELADLKGHRSAQDSELAVSSAKLGLQEEPMAGTLFSCAHG